MRPAISFGVRTSWYMNDVGKSVELRRCKEAPMSVDWYACWRRPARRSLIEAMVLGTVVG